jgi:hypothetical protein
MTQKQLQRRQVMNDPNKLAAWLNAQFQSGYTAVTLRMAKNDIPKMPIIANVVELDAGSCQINFHKKKQT